MIDPNVAQFALSLASLFFLPYILRLARQSSSHASNEIPSDQAWQYDAVRNAPERLGNGKFTRSSWRV